VQKKKDINIDEKAFASLEFDFFQVQLKFAFRIRPFEANTKNLRKLLDLNIPTYGTKGKHWH